MTDAPETLPPRAQVGYVLNNEIDEETATPGQIVGHLVGMGIHVEDATEMRGLAADVLEHRRGDRR